MLPTHRARVSGTLIYFREHPSSGIHGYIKVLKTLSKDVEGCRDGSAENH